MAKNNGLNLNLPSVDDLFSTEESRAEEKLQKVRDLPLSEIDAFPDHPFKVLEDDAMLEMVDSIKRFGVLTPAVARQKEDGRYELISGHRRKRACELAGLETLPTVIRQMSRDEAIIFMVDSNLQRETILPSEKAFSYKMRLEAMRRQQGQRTDLTSVPVGQKLDGKTSRELLAEKSPDSNTQIQRYIRLTELIPEVLQMVDESKIAFRPAVEISYLPKEEQHSFSEWIWKDIDRREMLCKLYNETFNAIRPREYDGQHIRFSGMNPEITLRKHQINAIAHIMYGGNTLLAHEVGAGKTFEMVAAAMESKRLGLCSKSLIVVPNHITEQWAAEWLQLYPSANILVATKKDFETKNRKKFCGRIATGDYDAVIIGHSQFEKIPMSKERQETIIQRQIDEIMYGISEAKSAKAERYTIKQLEKMKKGLELKLAKLNDQSRKDSVVTFEELGVDRIFIDESHYFKNLFLMTKMRNVGGIAQTEAQKSSDLFMKCQYLDEITGGRGTIFATGTPISNSMVELYTIQRYLQYKTLQDIDMLHFDDWAANYGETVTAIDITLNLQVQIHKAPIRYRKVLYAISIYLKFLFSSSLRKIFHFLIFEFLFQ